MKVVINNSVGGFGLSPKAIMMLYEMQSELIEEIEFDNYFWEQKDVEEYNIPVGNGLFTNYYEIGIYNSNKNVMIMESIYREDNNRRHPDLIKVIKELGEEANGKHSNLKIVEIPDDVDYYIEQNDCGNEWIAEKHRTWD